MVQKYWEFIVKLFSDTSKWRNQNQPAAWALQGIAGDETRPGLAFYLFEQLFKCYPDWRKCAHLRDVRECPKECYEDSEKSGRAAGVRSGWGSWVCLAQSSGGRGGEASWGCSSSQGAEDSAELPGDSNRGWGNSMELCQWTVRGRCCTRGRWTWTRLPRAGQWAQLHAARAHGALRHCSQR